MKIARIILRVTDLERSLRFWNQTVGLEMIGQGGLFAFLDGGGTQLVLNEVAERPEGSSLTELVIEFENVKAAYVELSARGVPFEVDLRAVTTDNDRDLLAAHFRDPDGHLCSVTGWVSS